jgi:dihydropyrimidinase
MPVDLVIKNSNLVIPEGGIVKAGIAITDGKISSLATDLQLPSAQREIDAKGMYVFPGLIDPHVHYGHNYGRYRIDLGESLASETISAALGGVTTINIVHRLYPASNSYFTFFEKEMMPVSKGVASTDFLLTFGIMNDLHVSEVMEYAKKLGVLSFKFFRGYKGREGEQLGAAGLDDGTFYGMVMEIAKLGPNGIAAVHCENAEITNYVSEKVKASGKGGLSAWSEGRPKLAEVDSILSAIHLTCDVAEAKLYIPHVSSDLGIEAVARAKYARKRVLAETCPHYLTLTQDDDFGFGIRGKVNPPLRDKESIEKLWERIFDGTVDTIGTDHVPVRLAQKLGDGDIWSAGLGFPGTGTMLPIMMSEGFHLRGLGLQRIAQLTSCNSAKAFGIYPQKGTIVVGGDADLTIVDPKAERVVTAEKLQSAAGFTLYEGWKLKGWPVATILGGKVLVEDGQFVGKTGAGNYLRRTVETSHVS